MERLPIVVGNWKMNKTVGEAIELIKELKALILGVKGVEVVIAPPFTALFAVNRELNGSQIELSAQNLHWEEKGAYTGEISPLMLKDIGCKYVIIGHSERRQFFGEDDEIVSRKVKSAIRHGLKPIFCVGETLKERQEGKTFDVIEKQIEIGLREIRFEDLYKIVIAYEPVWAIGTGKTATPEQAEEVHQFIRKKVEHIFSGEISQQLRIQYGGSVTPENIKGLMAKKNIDGVLVGGASLNAETFSKIVRFKEI